MTVPDLVLNDGTTIPQLGFGVFQIAPEQTRDATLAALEVGYRHIDTAQLYGNEAGVGDALRDSGLERESVFVTSKLHIGRHDDPEAALGESLRRLGLEYIDLFLIHWPMPWLETAYVDTWVGLERAQAAGLVRSIGVSNFHEHHLDHLLDGAEVVPSVNQIEVHPFFAQNELRAVNARHGIVTQAWSPIAQGLVLDDPTILAIAQAHGRSAAQVVLRWHLQRGDVVFPKSVTRARVEENFALFDFTLTDDDMAQVNGLDRDQRTGFHPDKPLPF